MTSFEYFTVLLSFVVSLGVASLLHSVIRLIQEGPRVQFSLAWALWATAIFVLQVVFWLRSWAFHEGFTLQVYTSIPPLVLAIVSFFACGFATPHITDGGLIDLRRFHEKQGPKYQIAYAAFMLAAVVQSALMIPDAFSLPSFWMDVGVQTTIAFVCIACAIFHGQRWLQIAAPAIFLVAAVMYYNRLMEA